MSTMNRAMELFAGDPLKGDIIDIGQGDGALVAALNSDNSIRAVGIDIADGVNFEKDAFPFSDQSFDHAILYSVIEHLYDPGNLMTELRRMLRPGGSILFIIPNILTAKEEFFNDPTHVHPYTPISINKLMSLYRFNQRFLGLWTAGKSDFFWKLPMNVQMTIGKYLPYSGEKRFVPSFLKGQSKSMLGIYQKA